MIVYVEDTGRGRGTWRFIGPRLAVVVKRLKSTRRPILSLGVEIAMKRDVDAAVEMLEAFIRSGTLALCSEVRIYPTDGRAKSARHLVDHITDRVPRIVEFQAVVATLKDAENAPVRFVTANRSWRVEAFDAIVPPAVRGSFPLTARFTGEFNTVDIASIHSGEAPTTFDLKMATVTVGAGLSQWDAHAAIQDIVSQNELSF